MANTHGVNILVIVIYQVVGIDGSECAFVTTANHLQYYHF